MDIEKFAEKVCGKHHCDDHNRCADCIFIKVRPGTLFDIFCKKCEEFCFFVKEDEDESS